MNQQMKHRHEAVPRPDGSWVVNELIDITVVHQTASSSRRDALSEAVRLNRRLLRDERLARPEPGVGSR